MKQYVYADEENGELVFKTITEQGILDEYLDTYTKMMTAMGRGGEVNKDACIKFWCAMHLGEEIKPGQQDEFI